MAHQLTLNTTSLEELKAKVNALPEPEIMQDGKTATPTEATQTIVPDSGFGGLSSVTVNPIPDKYEDRTESLPQLNTVNGGTEATTIAVAVDNTDTLVSDEDALIEQAIAALEGKSGGAVLLQEKTVTPSTSSQAIEPDNGYDGLSKVTVSGDSDLVAGNIKSGVSIFGVEGSYEGEGGSSSSGGVDTCTVILKGNYSSQVATSFAYTAVDDNGNVSSKLENNNNSLNITLNNVVCGSILVVGWYSYAGSDELDNSTHLGQLVNHNDRVYTITASPGGTATILNYSNTGGGN